MISLSMGYYTNNYDSCRTDSKGTEGDAMAYVEHLKEKYLKEKYL